MNIGIIGVGVVGDALRGWFAQRTNFNLRLFDPDRGMYGIIPECDIVFISVPVPTKKNGQQDLSLIEESIGKCSPSAHIFIRSTVLPGTCDKLAKRYNRRIYAMPEFLTERTAQEDMEKLPIIAGTTVYWDWMMDLFPGKQVIPMTNTEAEMAKYAHNVFAAVKVNYFNTIYHACDVLDANYQKVLEGAMITGFIVKTHTKVPGPDGLFGYGGKCLPKDLVAFATFLEDEAIEGFQMLKETDMTNAMFRNSTSQPIQKVGS